jgi:hypothetical protein
MAVRCHHNQPPPVKQIAQFYVQRSSNFSDPPCSAASFEGNSEPHTGARPSVRLCVGLTSNFLVSSYPAVPF